jgi:phytoene synthase
MRRSRDLRAYSARVASAVGAMMCVLMGVRDPHALARACDLGVAMQLTNIARDVGEDARAGRLYLPTDWLEEEGIDAGERFSPIRARPAHPPHGQAPAGEANRLYFRSEPGIARLPVSAAPASSPRAIATTPSGASWRAGHDSVTTRAYTTKWHKIGLLGLSLLRAGRDACCPKAR